MFDLIYKGSSSACFEWQNDLPYYCDEYKVLLDGNEVLTGKTNVFSLFGLAPDTEYTVTVMGSDCKMTFRTEKETCCVSVRDFGAVGDGKTNDTRAVQSAINCLPAGGRLFFPAGNYLVSPLCMKSDTTLELSGGAVILGITDEDEYPLIPGELTDTVTGGAVQCGTWEGEPATMRQALIFGENLRNVRIVGQGTVDGNAQNGEWWNDLDKRTVARPRLIFMNDCDGVYLHGITCQNSASWQLQPFFSRDVNVLDVKINAPKDSPNTDGFDPESCNGVNVIGTVISVGDDCIAIKSGRMYMGAKYKAPAENHVIRNCLMQFGHGAVTLGSEMSGGVKNLTVNRCVFNATDRGLRIKTCRGRGNTAVIDGITFENVIMDNVLTPIVMNMWYSHHDPKRVPKYIWDREPQPIDERTPYLGEFCFRGMKCTNCHNAAVYCDGLTEQPIRSVTLEDISFDYSANAEAGHPAMRVGMTDWVRRGMYFDNVGEVIVKNVVIDGCDGDEVEARHVGKLTRE